MHRRSLPLLLGLTLLAVPSAAGAAAPGATPEGSGGSCAMPASPAPAATPACGPTGDTVPVAVIEVIVEPGLPGELYRIELTTPAALEGALAIARGESAATIPNGVVVDADPGPNAPWSWHIDPATLEWAEMTMEVCDGRPTQLQDGVFTYERFCPWSARLFAILGDPDAPQIGWTTYGGEAAQASGGTSDADRTWSRWLPLTGGSYTLRIETGPNLDPTVSGCPAEVRLLTVDGRPAPGPVDPFPTVQPDDAVELTWPDLPEGVHQVWLSLACEWSMTFGRASSSAS